MLHEVVCSTIEVVGCDDMVTIACHVLEGIGDCSCTRSHCQSGNTAFEGCYTILEHTLGGVGKTTIDITCITQTESVCCML